MKNIRIYSCSVLLLCAGLLGACSDDPETEQAYVQTDSPTFTANKRGVAADGETLRIGVRSNTYWIIRQQAEDDWFTLSPKAGSGSREVEAAIAANTGQERSATLVFETEQGRMQQITLRQEGHNSTVRFLNDDFGTGTSAQSVAQFDGWNRNGIGSLRCQYWGNDVNVDAGQPSAGYDGASGGNGHRLRRRLGQFHPGRHRPQGRHQFQPFVRLHDFAGDFQSRRAKSIFQQGPRELGHPSPTNVLRPQAGSG